MDNKTSDSVTVRNALRRAFSLGQTYWQQADSDSIKQNRKSEETQAKFNALVTDTCAALSAPAQQAVTDEMVERALDYFYDNSPFNGPDELKDGLRATLLAALAQPQAAQAADAQEGAN